jgi:hypothetical protein
MNAKGSAAVVGQALRLPCSSVAAVFERRGENRTAVIRLRRTTGVTSRPPLQKGPTRSPGLTISLIALLAVLFATDWAGAAEKKAAAPGLAQVPSWSAEDLKFFLHGSMSTEVVPEAVLRAFIKTYPDLFPNTDLTHLGLIPDPDFGWPIGFSRGNVKHLGNLPSVGVNCASCHVARINSSRGGDPVWILGVTSHFDAEAYFGAVTVAGFQTSKPENMKKFMKAYLGDAGPNRFDDEWRDEEAEIVSIMKSDPFGAQGIAAGELHNLTSDDVRLHRKAAHGSLAMLAHSMLKLFHNMRAALHIPDRPPEKAPPASGPGRNDAFGLLSAGLFNAPQPYAPVKFGLVWNVGKRHWVHWDANTRSPIGRNLLASLGLGAPLHGRRGDFEFALVKRQTDLTEQIQPPRYPFEIDRTAAKRGATHFEAQCASCHAGEETDKRLFAINEIGTDPVRATVFTQTQADRFNKFLSELEAVGYEPSKEAGLRGTGKYIAPTLSGVWARSPYLHNGSVRTLQQLLTSPDQRAKSFHRGSRVYDEQALGYTDEGAYVLDTSASGNSSLGHDYGTRLTAEEKQDLIEYLKTL